MKNAEVNQTRVREYFLAQHCRAGFHENIFEISFSLKNGGVQTGFICDVSNVTQTFLYFFKTHQYRPTEDNLKSAKPPDMKEMFVCKLSFILVLVMVFLLSFQVVSQRKRCILLQKIVISWNSSSWPRTEPKFKALLQLDLISLILCLWDCANNYSNCGQVGNKPMIVDFRIKTQVSYVKAYIFDGFLKRIAEFRYVGLMATGIKSSEMKNWLFWRKLLEKNRQNFINYKTSPKQIKYIKRLSIFPN